MNQEKRNRPGEGKPPVDLKLRDVKPEGEHLRENVACPRCRGNSVIDTDVKRDCLVQTCLDSDPKDPHITTLGKAWAGRLDDLPEFTPEEAPSPFEEKPKLVTACPQCGAEATVRDPGKGEALLASCKEGHAFKLGRTWLKTLKAPV